MSAVTVPRQASVKEWATPAGMLTVSAIVGSGGRSGPAAASESVRTGAGRVTGRRAVR
jgi:hypothetical protein